MLWTFMTVVMTVIAILVAKEAFDKQKKRNEKFESTLKTKSLSKEMPKYRPYNSSESFSASSLPVYKNTDFNKPDCVAIDRHYMPERLNNSVNKFNFYRDTHQDQMPKYIINLPGSNPNYYIDSPEGLYVRDWRTDQF